MELVKGHGESSLKQATLKRKWRSGGTAAPRIARIGVYSGKGKRRLDGPDKCCEGGPELFGVIC